MSLSDLFEFTSVLLFPGIIFGATSLVKLNQTPLTLTLMEHDEREMHIFRQKVTMYIALFLMCFVIGVCFNCYAHPGFASEINIISNEQKDDDLEDNHNNEDVTNTNVSDTKPAIEAGTEDNVVEEEAPIPSDLLIKMLIMITASSVIAEIIRRVKKETNGNKFDFFKKYLLEVWMTLSIVAAGLSIIVGPFTMSFKSYLLFDGFMSLYVIIFVFVIKEYDPIKDKRRKAYLKTYFNDRVVYLYESKGEYLIAGDDEYYEGSTEFWFIKLDELKDTVVTALETELLILDEDLIEIDNDTARTDTDVLDLVGYDYYRSNSNKNIPTDKKICIKGNDKDVITYTIDGVSGRRTVQEKPVNRTEWKTAIIINQTA